jgi:plasmid stability protein
MATLLLRNLPDKLYAWVKEKAKRDKRSVPAEIIYLLEIEIAERNRRDESRQALDGISERLKYRQPTGIDSLTLLREGREERGEYDGDGTLAKPV